MNAIEYDEIRWTIKIPSNTDATRQLDATKQYEKLGLLSFTIDCIDSWATGYGDGCTEKSKHHPIGINVSECTRIWFMLMQLDNVLFEVFQYNWAQVAVLNWIEWNAPASHSFQFDFIVVCFALKFHLLVFRNLWLISIWISIQIRFYYALCFVATMDTNDWNHFIFRSINVTTYQHYHARTQSDWISSAIYIFAKQFEHF